MVMLVNMLAVVMSANVCVALVVVDTVELIEVEFIVLDTVDVDDGKAVLVEVLGDVFFDELVIEIDDDVVVGTAVEFTVAVATTKDEDFFGFPLADFPDAFLRIFEVVAVGVL